MYQKSVSKPEKINCLQVKYNYQDVSLEICKYLEFQNHSFGQYSPTLLNFVVVDIQGISTVVRRSEQFIIIFFNMHLCSEHNQTKKAFISSKKCHLSIFLHAFQMLLLKKVLESLQLKQLSIWCNCVHLLSVCVLGKNLNYLLREDKSPFPNMISAISRSYLGQHSFPATRDKIAAPCIT